MRPQEQVAEMAQRSKELVLVGLFGETSCLSTLMEGYGRNHVFTYLADASAKGRIYKGGAKIPWNRLIMRCKRGHPLYGDNLLNGNTVRRVCKACMRMRYEKRKSS